MKKLKNLRCGDAFWFESGTYIAIALTEDPFDVYCLNVRTHKLEELEEDTDVEVIEGWELRRSNLNLGIKGKKLRVIDDYE